MFKRILTSSFVIAVLCVLAVGLIGFGGVREIAPAVLNNATHAVYTEEKLCQFLRRLL